MRVLYFDDLLPTSRNGERQMPVRDPMLTIWDQLRAGRTTMPNIAVVHGAGAEHQLLAAAEDLEGRSTARVRWVDCPARCQWPFGGVIQLLEQLRADLAADREACAIVRDVADAIGVVLPRTVCGWLADYTPPDPFATVETTYLKTAENSSYISAVIDELSGLVRRLLLLDGRRRSAPAVVVFANLQWIDLATHKLLHRLVRSVNADPLLVCLHVDDLEADSSVARLLRDLTARAFAVCRDARTQRPDVVMGHRLASNEPPGAAPGPLDPAARTCVELLAVADVPLTAGALASALRQCRIDPRSAPVRALADPSIRGASAGPLIYLSAAWKSGIDAREVAAPVRAAAFEARRQMLMASDLVWCDVVDRALQGLLDPREPHVFEAGFHAFEKCGDSSSALGFYGALRGRTRPVHGAEAKLAAITAKRGDRARASALYAEAAARCDAASDTDKCVLLCQSAVNAAHCGRVADGRELADQAAACLAAMPPGEQSSYLAARVGNARSFVEYRASNFALSLALLAQACRTMHDEQRGSPYRGYEYVLQRNAARVLEAAGAPPAEYVAGYRRALRLCERNQRGANATELLLALGRAHLRAKAPQDAERVLRRLLQGSRGSLRGSVASQCWRVIELYRAHGLERLALRWDLRLARFYVSHNRVYDAVTHLAKSGLRAWSLGHPDVGRYLFQRSRELLERSPRLWDRERLLSMVQHGLSEAYRVQAVGSARHSAA